MAWQPQAVSSLGGVDDVDATVLGPAALVVLAARRTLFTVADHRDLAGGGTMGLEGRLDRLGTTLAQAEVVLARATLVGVAFQAHLRARTILQVLGMAGHDLLELGLDGGLVEIEVDHALTQARVGVQVGRGVAGRLRRLGLGRLLRRRWRRGRFDLLLLAAGRDADGTRQRNQGKTNALVHGTFLQLLWKSEVNGLMPGSPAGVSCYWLLRCSEWSPGRRADTSLRKHQPLAHVPIGGHCIKYATRPLHASVQEHASVRSKARVFVEVPGD